MKTWINLDAAERRIRRGSVLVARHHGLLAIARIRELEDFARTCRDGFDCDTDAHRYGTTCRACEAKRILTPANAAT